ncbi:MAG TPA: hypothetical protein VG269_02275 [Tepidisphaeraceae bacterium]|jgi:hypothetical protein|nr:hypothetical protein [Tepidisphaeraceae bacterium]
MNPQDAGSLASRLAELFPGITPTERDLVATTLEKFSYDTAEAVIGRYAEETASFDRGKLRTLLWEEHSRRTRRISPTEEWKLAKNAELKAIEGALASIPKGDLEAVVDDVRKKRAEVFRHLGSDPLRTEIGKALIYSELKNRHGK